MRVVTLCYGPWFHCAVPSSTDVYQQSSAIYFKCIVKSVSRLMCSYLLQTKH